jgi:hypothetical protein
VQPRAPAGPGRLHAQLLDKNRRGMGKRQSRWSICACINAMEAPPLAYRNEPLVSTCPSGEVAVELELVSGLA